MTTLATGCLPVRTTPFERTLLGLSTALADYVAARARHRATRSYRALAAHHARTDDARLLTEAHVAHGMLPR